MAQYTRFEIYIPVVYSTKEIDPKSGREVRRKHALDPRAINNFVNRVQRKYQGITQANPVGPAIYKGWWRNPDKRTNPPDIDYLTYLFGLVRIDQTDEAVIFFKTWKRKFEQVAHKQVILVLYYPVHTIGDFL